MQVIGFNFTKISSEYFPDFKGNAGINTNIEFLNVEDEKLSLLKDEEAVKVTFQYSVIHSEAKNQETKEKKKEKNKEENKRGEIVIGGNIILSSNKDELKDLQKSWKKKELPDSFKVPLFNLILRKCSPKAMDLADQINLPLHIPLPQLTAQPKTD